MKVTKEGDYGLRAVILLASIDGRLASASEISRQQNIPQKFLARIMPKLGRRGLIISTPGSKGGYRPPRRSDQITFLEVLEAIEGPILLNHCLGESCECLHEHLCSMKNIWKNAQVKLMDYFGSITMNQLGERTVQ